jgi:hypothetical protein
MITIFGDFRQFSAIVNYFRRFSPIFGKKLRFLFKKQCYDPKFAETSGILCKKNAKFLPNFLA